MDKAMNGSQCPNLKCCMQSLVFGTDNIDL